MTVFLIILLAIGVAGKQSGRYYAHVLGAVGAWIVLIPTAMWLSLVSENPMWGILSFLLHGLSWAVPIVIIVNGYERKGAYRLIPRRRSTTDK